MEWQPIDDSIIAEQQRSADFYLKAGLLRQRLNVNPASDAGFSLPS